MGYSRSRLDDAKHGKVERPDKSGRSLFGTKVCTDCLEVYGPEITHLTAALQVSCFDFVAMGEDQ